ncbi:Auxin-responsive protein SAUR40 [Bienertia sinuspersici]
MKDFIGKIAKKKEQYASMSPNRYSKICNYDDEGRNHEKHEARRGFVPILVGTCEEEEERFMVPLGLMKHPSIVDLLQLSANEFGYNHQGVLHIPCESHHFRGVIGSISSKKKKMIQL